MTTFSHVDKWVLNGGLGNNTGHVIPLTISFFTLLFH